METTRFKNGDTPKIEEKDGISKEDKKELKRLIQGHLDGSDQVDDEFESDFDDVSDNEFS